MKVSVIVPNYNHAPFLKQRIDSILNQTFQDFELILLDDCSTDNSREVLLSYKDNLKVTHVIFNDKNGRTPFKQWHKGVELAKGEWIWIAESDDFAELNFLETLILQAEKCSTVGMIYSHIRWVDERSKEMYFQICSGSVNFFSGEDFIKCHLLYSTTILNVGSLIFRKNIFEKIAHAKYKNMLICGDYFFFVLMAEYTDVIEISAILNNYRIHGANTSFQKTIEGVNFIEGMEILDYITKKYKIKPNKYSLQYARSWEKHIYAEIINKKVMKSFLKNHKLVVFYYFLLKLYHRIKHH